MIYGLIGLTTLALSGLGLRALFAGVCNHLEADDVPLHAGVRYLDTRAPATIRAGKPRRSATPVMAHAGHR